MRRQFRSFLAFVFMLLFLSGTTSLGADLPSEPSELGTPTAQNGASILPQITGPAPEPTDVLTTPSNAHPGYIDLSHAVEPGYLDSYHAQYEDGVLQILETSAPITLRGSTSTLRIVCHAGVQLILENVAISGQDPQALITWLPPENSEGTVDTALRANITYSGSCQISNTSGLGVYAPGDLFIAPAGTESDSLIINAQTVCAQSGGILGLDGSVLLTGQTGVEAIGTQVTNDSEHACLQIHAEEIGISCEQDVLLQGAANVDAGSYAVYTTGNISVQNAFMSLAGQKAGICCAGNVTLGSGTVFVESIIDPNGDYIAPGGQMGDEGAFIITDLEPESPYSIQEVRSTWGSGRELEDVYSTANGSLLYYTIGSATEEGRRYIVNVDDATRTISFESLTQSYQIDLGAVATQSASLPDGVTLEPGRPTVLRINNSEAQITLTGQTEDMKVIVESAQMVTLDTATMQVSTDCALSFEHAGETNLVFRGSSSIQCTDAQPAIRLLDTTLHIRQSAGAGELSITGNGPGIASLSTNGVQDLYLESGTLQVETSQTALSTNSSLYISGGTALLHSTESQVCTEAGSLHITRGSLHAVASAPASYGVRVGQANLTGGVTYAAGDERGLSTQNISMRDAALNTQTITQDGTGLYVESMEGNNVQSRVLITNFVLPPGLSGRMMTAGPHIVGSLEPGHSYEVLDETQGRTVSLGEATADIQGQVAYYSDDPSIYAIVFGDKITLVNQAAYVEQTLTDSATGIRVAGSIPFNAHLSVTDLTGGDLTAMRLAAGRSEILFPVNIQLLTPEGQSASFDGPLNVTFPVGSEYDGQTLNVIHILTAVLGAHELERTPVAVAHGELSVQCVSLSPFAIQLPVSDAVSEEPAPTQVPIETHTSATTVALWAFITLCAGMCIWGIVVLHKHVKQKKQTDDNDQSTSGRNRF